MHLQADEFQAKGATFIKRLEQHLQAVPGIDAVLATLVLHCQQNLAADSKLITGSINNSRKQEAIDVACLSSIQEHHSSARALPLLLRLYFTNNSRAAVRIS